MEVFRNSKYVLIFGSIVLLLLAGISGCKKNEVIIIPDNNHPYYDEVTTNGIENYVNRTYIDLIGREPLNDEMANEVLYLKENKLRMGARDTMIYLLQNDTTFVEGDSSYKRAYYRRFYELTKVRMIEAASRAEIGLELGNALFAALKDSLEGDSVGAEKAMATANKLQALLNCDYYYFAGYIDLDVVFVIMLDNSVYDKINMNTFNFINASFDDLFFRFPAEDEFNNGFDMIEYNLPGMIFGSSGSTKTDYINILLNSREFYEGMIRWAYITLLAREPGTLEISTLMTDFFYDHDFQKVQREIIKTDEYANF